MRSHLIEQASTKPTKAGWAALKRGVMELSGAHTNVPGMLKAGEGKRVGQIRQGMKTLREEAKNRRLQSDALVEDVFFFVFLRLRTSTSTSNEQIHVGLEVEESDRIQE